MSSKNKISDIAGSRRVVSFYGWSYARVGEKVALDILTTTAYGPHLTLTDFAVLKGWDCLPPDSAADGSVG